MRAFFRWIFKIRGWDIQRDFPADVKKGVVAHAPHTSNWDFLIGWMAFVCFGRRVRILIKKELFFPGLGWILKGMGGLPVDRKKKTNLVDQVADMLRESDDLLILFTPEGTRSYSPKWKTGFYWVAVKSETPIILAYIDYTKKKGGTGPVIHPSGDVDADLVTMKKFFAPIDGKNKEDGVKWPEPAIEEQDEK